MRFLIMPRILTVYYIRATQVLLVVSTVLIIKMELWVGYIGRSEVAKKGPILG
jgi:hypothetical protein